MESEREWYQQNVDRLLEPSLWVASPDEGEDKEQTVTKKLGKVAKDFFKNRSESTPASSAGKTASEELLSEFIKLEENSPETVQSSKKKLKEDFLGHVAEIDIRSETRLLGDFSVVPVVRGQRTKCLGGFIQYNFVKIRKSLLEFSKEFPKVLTPGMSGMIRNTTASNCHSIQSPDELLQRWASGKPIVMNTGYAGHSMTVVVWKDKFIINNRGPGIAYDGPEAITMQVFTFDRSRFSAEIIKDIISLLFTLSFFTQYNFLKSSRKNWGLLNLR